MDLYCGEFGDIYPHIRVKLSIMATGKNIPEHLKIVLFRIVQETLTSPSSSGSLRKAGQKIDVSIIFDSTPSCTMPRGCR
jgi:signal transduction histidine kinase